MESKCQKVLFLSLVTPDCLHSCSVLMCFVLRKHRQMPSTWHRNSTDPELLTLGMLLSVNLLGGKLFKNFAFS